MIDDKRQMINRLFIGRLNTKMVEKYKPGAAEKTKFKKGSETSRLRYPEFSIRTKNQPDRSNRLD